MYPQVMPRNAWYVAAHSGQVTRKPLTRTIHGEAVLLYRRTDGSPIGLLDQCIHRQLPLSLGCIEGDNIRCGYHGLVFDTEGKCIEIPNQDNIPPSTRVRSFPLVEKDNLVWIWPGEVMLADENLIPSCYWLDSPSWTCATGLLHLNGRAQLLNENLLDLSHLEFLHPGSIGATKLSSFPVTVDFDEVSVRATRIMDDTECPQLFKKAMDLPDRIRRTQIAEWFAPGFHITHVGAAPIGDESRVHNHKVIHCVTPETDTSAHYFWAVCRDYRLEDDGLTQMLEESHYGVFCQDVVACEAIENVLQSYPSGSPPHVNIKVDSGSLKSRRIIEAMLKKESVAVSTK